MHNVQMDHHSLFEHMYTYAPIGIALAATDGTFMKVNPALCKLLGYTEEEMVGLRFQDVTFPEDLLKQTTPTKQLLEGAIPFYQIDKRYVKKDGTLIWGSLHVSLVRDDKSGAAPYFLSHIIDITEKKATQELYELISENAEDIIYCTNGDGICYYCSPSINQLGYEPEEIVGKLNQEIIHPDDLATLRSQEVTEKATLRYRNRHKAGHYLWFETTFKIIPSENGERKVLAIGREITERKKNEDMLAEAQRIAAIGSWEWDIPNDSISLSEQAYQVSAIDKSAAINHPHDILQLLHPDDRDNFKDKFKQALLSHAVDFEFRNVQPDGLIKYLHIRGIVTPDKEGNAMRMNGTLQDITERKKIEFKLQETVERYTSLKKYNHDAIISLDLEGNIIHGNAMVEHLTGFTLEELSGTSASIFIGTDHLRKILEDSINDISIEKNIDKFKHRDGHLIDVLTTIAPIIINNENVGFYIIAKDITEQKKLLIAKEAAESMNQAKSEFLAMMSHEIRTPMNGVIGMADLLAETTGLTAEQKEYVEIIRKSGHILLAIINDILDFSKIDSGKPTLLKEPFEIRDCILETFDVLSSKAGEKHLAMSYSISPEVAGTLIGDPERLKQILMNLVGNAIKFTPSGDVSVMVKPLGHRDKGMFVEFIVKDTGIGIPADKLGRLFEPFYQMDHFMTRKYEGTGLGLAISKKLVELMGGQIWVEPTEGIGATFGFTVLLEEPRTLQTPVVRGGPSGTGKQPENSVFLNVLVAEDNEINQQVLKRMLEKQGHSVTIAGDGNEVCVKAANGRYDLILMDVHMPMMNGLEATRMIRDSLPPGNNPVIVAVTANALKGDREKCLAAGMDDYISKPLKIETIAGLIRKFFLVPVTEYRVL